MMVEPEAQDVVVADSSGGLRKVSTQGRRGRTLVGNPAAAAWELFVCDFASLSLTHLTTTTYLDARISRITGKMSQPVVQTIHRDPALLYVEAPSNRSRLA